MAIEALGSSSGKLKSRVVITASGVLEDDEDEDDDIDYEVNMRVGRSSDHHPVHLPTLVHYMPLSCNHMLLTNARGAC